MTDSVVPIPSALAQRMRRSAEGRSWLESLPSLLDELMHDWGLVPDLPAGGMPWHGFTGIAVPVLRAGTPAVLKVSLPGEETGSEGPALVAWGGNGTVRMIHWRPDDFALLLERLDPTRTLWDEPLEEACEVWGQVMRRLRLPVPGLPGSAGDLRRHPRLRSVPRLAELAERYCDELPWRWEELGRPFPVWLLEAALETCQSLGAVGYRGRPEYLVHGDLHFQNVLLRPTAGGSAGTEWVGIDPQAVIGDPEYGVPPILRNRLGDYRGPHHVQAVSDRLRDFCSSAGLDMELARAWSVVSFTEDALWYLERDVRQASDSHAGEVRRSLWLASALLGRIIDDSVDPARLPDPGQAI